MTFTNSRLCIGTCYSKNICSFNQYYNK